jgi:hypothetical protein
VRLELARQPLADLPLNDAGGPRPVLALDCERRSGGRYRVIEAQAAAAGADRADLQAVWLLPRKR